MAKRKNVKNKNCLSSTELISYVDGLIQSLAREQADRHLEQCAKCRQNLECLTKIDKALAMKKPEKDPFIPDAKRCLNDEQKYRYLDNNLDASDAEKIEKHIVSCSSCANEIASLKNNLFAPMTAFEKEEIAKLKIGTVDEQVSKIISIVEKVNPQPIDQKKRLRAFLNNIWEMIKSLVPSSLSIIPKWEFGVAFASILIIFLTIVGVGKYRTWKSNIYAENGFSLMRENYVINSGEIPRPSGGFQYSEFGITRGERDFDEALELRSIFEKAIDLNQKSVNAAHYLGMYYLLFENNIERAKQLYLSALSRDTTNVPLLNDLGMLYLRSNDDERAMKYFQVALNYDPHMLEAQFNIALLYEKLQQLENAREAWCAYLKLDSESNWSIIAEEHLEKLN